MFCMAHLHNLYLIYYWKTLLDGFAFSQEEGGSVSQAELVRAYNTNIPKPAGNWMDIFLKMAKIAFSMVLSVIKYWLT